MTTPSILWVCSSLRHPSGNAIEYRQFLRAQERAGHEPAAVELSEGDDDTLSAEALETLARQLARSPEPPLVAVHAYGPRSDLMRTHRTAANVARVMFETDRLPAGWADRLACRDAVWVPSTHNELVFGAAGLDPDRIRVLPETMDFDAFAPGAAPYDLGAPEGHFTFLTSFDFSERKGWRELLLAWARAFEPADPVCLVLKTLSVKKWDEDHARERIEDFIERRLGRRSMAPVRIISSRLADEEIPGLYAGADAYVSASRGEAWGRTYMEAMAMGLPTIGTAYGGNLDFMGDDTWLVEGELVPIPDTAELITDIYRGHRWFEVDVDLLAAAMRDVAADPAASRARAAGSRERLIAGYGNDVIATRIIELARAALGAQLDEPVLA